MPAEYAIHPLTPDRWGDFETLFGPRGATGGCWCMFFRMPNQEYRASVGAKTKAAIRDVVEHETPPGLLAYDGDKAVGWCAVAPREVYKRFERSRIMQPVDDQPAWAITCFFVAKGYRRKGVTRRLILAAVDFVRSQGGKIVEAYPVDSPKAQADTFMYTGIASAFAAAGFTEVARRSETRPVMRFVID